MLKALIDSWRSQRAQRELYDEFVQMLEMDWEMFRIVMDVLIGRAPAADLEHDILTRDIEVNRKERAIRRRLVEHMSLNPRASIPGSLVLMSVVKDAERIGDYCKNVLEVAQMLEGPASALQHWTDIVEIGNHVTQIFRDSIKAFSEVDEELAKEIIRDESLMTQRCDALVRKIARSDASTNDAVCSALLVRFFKRIDAHLSNICSSLVVPVHRLDYGLKGEGRGQTPQEGSSS